jgi:hypothetical protein
MGRVRELLEELSGAAGIRREPIPAETRAKWDRRTAELLKKIEKFPAKAEDGKAFVILWAEGRAIVAYRNKSDVVRFVKEKQEHDDIVWIHYERPVTKGGTTIRVRNKY